MESTGDNVLESQDRGTRERSEGAEPKTTYRVTRSNWGNDYQYHMAKLVDGKEVSRAPAPPWAWDMYLQDENRKTAVSLLFAKLMELSADEEKTEAVRVISKELSDLLKSLM